MSPEHKADLVEGRQAAERDRERYGNAKVHELSVDYLAVSNTVTGEVKVLRPVPGGYAECDPSTATSR